MKADSEIQADVIQELKWDPSVSHEHIGVSIDSGIVILTGTVPTYIEKKAAEYSARGVSGVKAVVEKIEVHLPSSLQKTDQDIARTVLDSFRWNTQVPDRAVKITVSDGWVALSGEVEWRYQKNAAEYAVQNLSGVRGISNKISIAPKIKPNYLKFQIERALRRSTELEAKKINVSVDGSKIILDSEIQSFTEMTDIKGVVLEDCRCN